MPSSPADRDLAPPVEIVVAPYGSALYRTACVLREEVLRRPIGLALAEADTAPDAAALHLVAHAGGAVVGCVQAVSEGRAAKLRQMAVRADKRRQGLGRALVERLEAELRGRGIAEIHLNARVEALPFYERLGFLAEGPVFIDIRVPHRHMRKPLAL